MMAFLVSFGMSMLVSACAGSPEIFGSVMTLPALLGSVHFVASVTGALPYGITAMSYVQVDINKSMSGSGGNKKGYIHFFLWDDVATAPGRDDNGIETVGNVVMKAGKYMSSLHVTESTIKIDVKGEGEPDAKGIMQTLAFSHPGNSKEIKEFQYNMMNGNFGMIIESCSGSRRQIMGSPCAPLQMKFDATDDKDKNNSTFTFESSQKGPHIGEYMGTLTLASVTSTVDADETTINLASGEGRYQLTTGASDSVAIDAITNPTNNGVYTLVGSGGSYPSTVESGGPITLVNNATWTAIAGSTLTFKCIKVNSTPYFYELSRT